MRERILGAVVGFAVIAGMPLRGQMHKVAAPQQVVRAVGVYEWTGDMAKPKASRLIPVSLFINGQFQDAGVYLARPVPLALDTGNVYELRVAGLDRGLLDLESARHVQDANNDFEDSWYGYGKFRMPAPPRPRIAKRLPSARTSGIVSTVADSDRPTLVRRHGSGSGTSSGSGSGSGSGSSPTQASSGSAPVSDPDRPVLHRASDDGAGNGDTGGGYGGNDPSYDPDRPILQKPADESAGSSSPAESQQTTTASSGTSASQPGTGSAGTASAGTASASSGTATAGSGGSEPSDDPNRPTLKRRTPEEAKQAREEATVQGTGADLALNNDPNRPRLHFGKPAGEEISGPARLVGLPVDLHQMVAVSDAVDRDPHNFARNWADAEERAAILAKMQGLARAQLTGYGAPPVAAVPAATQKKTKTAAQRSRKKAVAPPPPVALMDEVLRGYTLSYGGDPTYVYMAHTAGTGVELRYVTVVAQTDEMGELKPVIQSVTDAAHLDRTAWMKFVDVVDADATNRASLLFELKSQNMRQFALYRVIAGQAQQIFVSGTAE